MTPRFLEHGLSLLLVGVLFLAALWWYNDRQADLRSQRGETMAPFLTLDSVDYSNSYHREIFRETAKTFFSGDERKADSLLWALDSYRAEKLTSFEYKAGGKHELSWDDMFRLLEMCFEFVVVYVVAMALTAAAGRGLAIYRFVRGKQLAGRVSAQQNGGKSRLRIVADIGFKVLGRLGSIVASAVLFSPAYVVAYALKGDMDTNSLLFLVLLAVLTNGVLVSYATRFQALLVAESRKGYVDTALVKNLANDWSWGTTDGIPWKVLWAPLHAAQGHVFEHIYLKARYHYLPSLKEHASFLITGLIIIEMALNIQGHLGYELLRNLLYRRYDIVVTILFAVFLLVKVTEVLVDMQVSRETQRYANAE